jgi:hypothetical protein
MLAISLEVVMTLATQIQFIQSDIYIRGYDDDVGTYIYIYQATLVWHFQVWRAHRRIVVIRATLISYRASQCSKRGIVHNHHHLSKEGVSAGLRYVFRGLRSDEGQHDHLCIALMMYQLHSRE